MVDKRTMHEPSIRIPIVVSGPGLPVGKVVTEQVLTVDIAPSVLELCQSPPLDGIQGRSWVKLAHSADLKWRRAWFYEYNYEKQFPYTPNIRGIRTNEWKLIRYPHGDGSEDRHTAELYHLKTDPDELHNLAEDVDHQRVRQRLQNLLSDMLTAEGLTQETDKMPLDEGIQTELPDQKIR